MWPLAIVLVIALYFMHIVTGVSSNEQHIQNVRESEGAASLFRSYDAAGASMIAANPALSGAIDSAHMNSALRDVHMDWAGTAGWCDRGVVNCSWGAIADSGQFYVYRNDLSEGTLLRSVYRDLLTWTSAPDQLGFKRGSNLLGADGIPLRGRTLPSSVQSTVPDGALLKIL
ncbi:hypothetical protein HBF26_07395 [Luteibacter jiangsuensis]|uniref:PilM protein n=1 Tax=Luteibacter jiangsuensis TaxID=637577 RepID=A0ABX0Q363_9GAMM|nr:hypothetical protein [Luteibacter jiangsuensis]NID04706.1 hypothetical protein [Luteibacter jiangsuensis]